MSKILHHTRPNPPAKRRAKTPRTMSREELDRTVAEIVQQRGQLAPEQEAYIREDIRLDHEYAGLCVAFVDAWKGSDLSRNVVAWSESEEDFWRSIDELPAEVKRAGALRTRRPTDANWVQEPVILD